MVPQALARLDLNQYVQPCSSRSGRYGRNGGVAIAFSLVHEYVSVPLFESRLYGSFRNEFFY